MDNLLLEHCVLVWTFIILPLRVIKLKPEQFSIIIITWQTTILHCHFTVTVSFHIRKGSHSLPYPNFKNIIIALHHFLFIFVTITIECSTYFKVSTVWKASEFGGSYKEVHYYLWLSYKLSSIHVHVPNSSNIIIIIVGMLRVHESANWNTLAKFAKISTH